MTERRRAHGEGSVYRGERGRGWFAQLELTRDANGRRRRIRRRARTRAEANQLLKEMREEFLTTGRIADRQRLVTETVAEYLEVRRAVGLSASSLAREERFADLISSYFGRVRTSELTVQELDEFLYIVSIGVPDQTGQPTRSRVGRDHLRRLRATLQRAIRNDQRLGLVSSNAALLAELPSDTTASRSRRALTLGELGELLQAGSGAVGVVVDLVGRHGLRPAEARAMTWSNIRIGRDVMRVTAQIGTANTFAPPKTSRAKRTIPIHSETIERLNQWALEQTELKAIARQAWMETDLVASTSTGTPLDRNNLNRALRRLCEQVGIEPKVTLYELRHTAITHQCEAGHQAWQVADWAGTSEKMIYLHYRHLLDELVALPPLDV